MTRSRSITFLASAAALLAVLAVAGCGSGGNASGSPAPPKTKDGRLATVGIANEGLGKILVNSQARTLYLFQKDSGTMSEHRRLRRQLAAAQGEWRTGRW
jgi:hypothetical protein